MSTPSGWAETWKTVALVLALSVALVPVVLGLVAGPRWLVRALT